MALGLGLFFWIALLFSPLAMVQPVAADDSDNVGTVIGIVSQHICFSRSKRALSDRRI